MALAWVFATRGKRHSKRDRLWAISRDLCASICCAPVCAQRARSREWARLRKNSCAARAPWIAGPTDRGVARCMDSILERMRGKQSKCLAIRPPGGHIFQCAPLIGLGARMAACWRPGELPSGGAAVEVLSTTIVFQTGTASLQKAAGVLLWCITVPLGGRLAVGFACSARFFGHICSKTPNMGWIVDWRGWEGPEVPGMEVRFFPMAARSTVRGSQLEED